MAATEAFLIGGGLHHTLLALALARAGRTVRIAERGPTLGGNHLWCLHDRDLADDRERDLLAPLIVKRWPDYEVRFPNLTRIVPGGYAAVSSQRLHEAALPELLRRGAEVRLNTEVPAVGFPVSHADGAMVFDGRGPEHTPRGPCGWQKFLGQELRFTAPHGWTRPILMDATVAQHDGYRFVYVLPFDDHRALVEDTYYSDTPDLDAPALRRRIAEYAGPRAFEIEREEAGALPIPLTAPPAAAGLRTGYAGGFLHPTTGYSLPLAARCAVRLASAPPERWGAALAAVRQEVAGAQSFSRLLNRLLFRGYHPDDRWQVLERFHRVLPDEAIRRFYGLRATFADRARLMVGRPPRGFSLPRFARETWKARHA